MVYSSKDFESLWFFQSLRFVKANKFERLYQAEGLPKNISKEEFLGMPSGKAERNNLTILFLSITND